MKSSLEVLESRIAPASLQGGFETQFEAPATPDLTLTKTADVTCVHPSDTITYTIHVGNDGPAGATNVVVTDPVVAGLNFVATENPGWSLNQAQTAYVFNVGALAAGTPGTDLTLKLHVAPTVGEEVTMLTNTASVEGDQQESDTSNNSDAYSVDVIADAELHVSLRSETPEIAHGGKVVYSLIFSNTGDRDAHVILTDHPHGYSTVYASDNPGWSQPTLGVWEYDAGTVAARSGNHSVQFVVQMDYYIPTTLKAYVNDAGIQYASDEPLGNATGDTEASVSTPVYQGIYVLSPGTSAPGHYTIPKIQVVDITTGVKKEIQVYPRIVRDSIRTSLGDFNNDGFDDILVTTEHGVGPTRLFDGKTSLLMASPLNDLAPFGKTKGSFNAIGELEPLLKLRTSNDSPEVVFGSALGGGAVKIYSIQTPVAPRGDAFAKAVAESPTPQQIASFFPFGPKFVGGVRVAIGDVNGDGRNDLIVAQGNFGGQVKIYNAGNPDDLLTSFTVGGAKYKGGLNIAVGDIDGDGKADIVTGRNRLSAPTVETWVYQTGVTSSLTASGQMVLKGTFNAFAATYRNGVRVALADTDNDGYMDIIATTGYAGRSQVKVFDGALYHTQTTSGNNTLNGASLFGDDLTGLPFGLIPNPPVPQVAEPTLPITRTPELLKSFTAIPTNLNQAVWASATTVVPSVTQAPVIIFPFPFPPFPPIVLPPGGILN